MIWAATAAPHVAAVIVVVAVFRDASFVAGFVVGFVVGFAACFAPAFFMEVSLRQGMFDSLLLAAARQLPISIGEEVLGASSRQCPGCSGTNTLQRHTARPRHGKPSRFVPTEVLVCARCRSKAWDEGRLVRTLIVVTLLVPCVVVLAFFAAIAGYGILSVVGTEGVELNSDTAFVAAASCMGLLLAGAGIFQTVRVARKLLRRSALVVVPDRLFGRS